MTILNQTGTVINEQIDGVYGGIHVHDGVAAQTIPTGAGYTKLTLFTDNDPSNLVTCDAANSKMTVTKAGTYRIEGAFSMTADTNNVNLFAAPFADGVEIDSIHWERKIGTGADTGNANFSGLIELSAGQEIDTRLRHEAGGDVDVTMSYANMSLNRVGV